MNPVVFICKGELRFFYPRIAEAVSARSGWPVSAVVFNTLAARELEDSGIFDRVHCLPTTLRTAHRTRSVAEASTALRAIEIERSISANTLLFSDRILRRYRYDDALLLMAGMVDFWREVLATSPRAVFGELSTAAEWLWCEMSASAGVPYLMPYIAPTPGRFFLIDSPSGAWEAMRGEYNRLRAQGLTDVERQRADAYISHVRETREKQAFMKFSMKSPFRIVFAPSRLRARIGRLPFRMQSWRTDGMYEVGSYHGTNPMFSVFDDVMRVLRSVGTARRAYTAESPGGDFAYFPLHTQPEYTIDVRTPFVSNQLAVLENIARALPAGMQLAVKEHPEMQGRRPMEFLAALRRLGHVHILSPKVESHFVIQRSRLIVTITGSAAWEGRIYEKPVVVLGNVPYGFVDGIHTCTSMADLPRAINAALGTSVDPESLRTMSAALLASAHHGSIDDPIRRPAIMEPDNIEHIARGVIAEIERAAFRVAEPQAVLR